MLTARDTVNDRVAGLDAGADDYLVKPFAYEEPRHACGPWPAAPNPVRVEQTRFSPSDRSRSTNATSE